MDIRYFLNKRIAFIRQLHENAVSAFIERKRLIEAEEEPFDDPPYSESGEPAFLEEWLEAEESLHVLGCACLSMLSASLHLYLKLLKQRIPVPIDDDLKPVFKKNWFAGFQNYFARHCGITFDKCPADLALLEELVLARNRVQHPEDMVFHRPDYSQADLKKLRRPFFVDDSERSLFVDEADENEKTWLMPPLLHVTPEKIDKALTEVERFAEWLETVDPNG